MTSRCGSRAQTSPHISAPSSILPSKVRGAMHFFRLYPNLVLDLRQSRCCSLALLYEFRCFE